MIVNNMPTFNPQDYQSAAAAIGDLTFVYDTAINDFEVQLSRWHNEQLARIRHHHYPAERVLQHGDGSED